MDAAASAMVNIDLSKVILPSLTQGDHSRIKGTHSLHFLLGTFLSPILAPFKQNDGRQGYAEANPRRRATRLVVVLLGMPLGDDRSYFICVLGEILGLADEVVEL